MMIDIISRWKERNPSNAQSLGFHEYDGVVNNLDKESIKKTIDEIEEDLSMLKAVKEPEDKLEKFEYNLVKNELETELFFWRDDREYEKSPIPYIGPLFSIEGTYVSRSFASRDERIKAIIKIQEKAPQMFEQARINMITPLAKAKLMMSINFLEGLRNYFNDKLIEFVSKTNNDELLEKWSDVNERCINAMMDFTSDLKEKYLPEATNEFALGEEKFCEMLEKTEGVSLTAAQLLEIGENALNRDYQDIVKLADENNTTVESITNEMMKDIPKPEELIMRTNESLDRTRDFLIEKDLVSLPSKEHCDVVDMPEYAKQFAFAAMNTPGPFEKEEAKEAYYYVNIPPPGTNEMELQQRMSFFNLAQLELVTIHEAWPGHYLQLLVNNKSKSDIAKMFARSTTLIEGWGLYTEKMIIDEGYDKLDLVKLRMAQLKASAMRAARFVSAVKMHCYGLQPQEAMTEIFMKKAFMTEAMARIEANRGTINPMYLNYTLGKEMIYKLREDYKKEKGDKFKLKEFHDEMLSFASPPIAVLRKMMLVNPGNKEDFL